MFLIRTRLSSSGIHGIGVCAAEPVKAGTPIWRFDPRVDRLIPPAEVAALPPVGQEFIRTYTYQSPEIGEGQVLNGDNARFLNHSRQPNTDNAGPVTLAARDIAVGEEITCDYEVCCADFDPAEVGEA